MNAVKDGLRVVHSVWYEPVLYGRAGSTMCHQLFYYDSHHIYVAVHMNKVTEDINCMTCLAAECHG